MQEGKTLKLGRSGSIDLLDPEHIRYHGGETQVVAKENCGQNLYESLVIPIHKGKAKNPSNLEATEVSLFRLLSASFLKSSSFIIYHHPLKKLAYLTLPILPIRTVSPVQMLFLQEALLTHARDGGKPILCYYDIEKTFDSVEIPILLKQFYSIGVNGNWHLLKQWYTISQCSRQGYNFVLTQCPYILELGQTLSRLT